MFAPQEAGRGAGASFQEQESEDRRIRARKENMESGSRAEGGQRSPVQDVCHGEPAQIRLLLQQVNRVDEGLQRAPEDQGGGDRRRQGCSERTEEFI